MTAPVSAETLAEVLALSIAHSGGVMSQEEAERISDWLHEAAVIAGLFDLVTSAEVVVTAPEVGDPLFEKVRV